MNKPVIALDIDEVIFPFTAGVAEYNNRHHGTDLTADDFFTYDFWHVWGGDLAETNRRLDDFMLNTDHMHLQPVPGAREAIDVLHRRYEIALVTARNERLRDVTTKWFKQHMPKLFEHIHYAGNKYDGHAYRSKLEICRELGAELLIDDAPHNVADCAAGGMRTILFGDYAWQSPEEVAALPPSVVRCRDWPAVLEHLGLSR